MKYILAAFLLALSACGPVCKQISVTTGTYTFGTLEKVQCPEGESVQSVTPKYLPGGEVITHLVVQCKRLTCEGEK